MSCDHEARLESIDENLGRLHKGQNRVSEQLAVIRNEIGHINRGLTNTQANGKQLTGRVNQLEQSWSKHRGEHEGEHEGAGRTTGFVWSAVKTALILLGIIGSWVLGLAALFRGQGG